MPFSFRFIIILFLSIFSLNIYAADYYWVGGNGDWTDINHWATTSGGTLKHIQTPTPSDNVIFDQNSYTGDSLKVKLNIAVIQFKSMDLSTINKIAIFNGICTQMKIFGGLKMNIKAKFQINAQMSFESTATANTIYSNGFVFNNLEFYFRGTGQWTFMDDMQSNKGLTLEQGFITFQCSNAAASFFASNSSYNRKITLTNTKFTIGTWIANGANFLVDAGTSKLVLGSTLNHSLNGNATFYDVVFNNVGTIKNQNGFFIFHDVEMKNNGFILNTCTFNILKLTKTREYQFSQGTTQTIITNLLAESNCAGNIKMYSFGTGFNIVKTSGTIQVLYVSLQNSHASGGATFIANSSKDLGGNSGWNIQNIQSRNLYWVGGNGEWNDSIHWSATNGGPGGECIPEIIDNVFFTDLSFSTDSQEVSVKAKNAYCHNMIWNTTKKPAFTYTAPRELFISGSLEFCPLMYLLFDYRLNFVSDQSGETIKTSNIKIISLVLFNGIGDWTLLDSFKVVDNLIVLEKGILKTNSKYVISKGFASTNSLSRGLVLGSTIWDVLESNFSINQAGLTVNPGTSLVRFNSSNAMFFATGSPAVSFYNVLFTDTADRGTLKCLWTRFNKVTFDCDGTLEKFSSMDTLVFKEGKDYYILERDSVKSALIANGTCTKFITISSSHPFQIGYLLKASGSYTVNFCQLRSIYASTPIISTANNSGNLGNNSGWNFTNSVGAMYWIDGTGQWNDPNHWSFTSGGSPSGCIPNSSVDVFFDNNSFLTSSDTVYFGPYNIFHRNMTWMSAISSNPIMLNTSGAKEYCTGSIQFITNMDYKHLGATYFYGSFANKNILMNGQDFDTTIIFGDSCVWNFLDTMRVKGALELYKGKIVANNKCMILNDFYSYELNRWKVFEFGNGKMYLKYFINTPSVFFWIANSTTSINVANTEIVFKNSQGLLAGKGNVNINFFNVTFDTLCIGRVNPDLPQKFYFNKVKFLSSGGFYSESHMDTLLFSRNSSYYFEDNFHQYINNYWKADGDCYGVITINSTPTVGQAFVHKLNGNVVLNNIDLEGINAIGSSFVINDGNDNGNNSNWTINPISGKQLYWVNGSGDWNDTAHWSYFPGGNSGACIPTFRDDVHFDANSFPHKNDTVTISSYAECRDMRWLGTDSMPMFRVAYLTLNIFGSLTFIDSMIANVNGIYFVATTSGNTIKTAKHNLQKTIFNGSGSWTLLDSLISSDYIDFNSGTLNASKGYFETDDFNSLNYTKRTLNLDTSRLKIFVSLNFDSDSLVLNSSKSWIQFLPLTGTANHVLRVTGTKSLSFNKVEFPQYRQGSSLLNTIGTAKHSFHYVFFGNDATFIGEYTFDSLYFSAGNTYKLEKAKTQTINDFWYIRGNNCFAVNLESTLKYDYANVLKSSGIVSGDFINMRDNHAIGNASFFAGGFSSNIQNNAGWSFTNGPQYVFGLGKDTSFAIGGNVVLSTANFNGGPYTTYQWSTGATTPTITVNKVGAYIVTVTYDTGCAVIDTINVGCAINPSYSVTNAHCFGDSNGSIQVTVPNTTYTYSYLWSSGDTTKLISGKPSGNYLLTISVDTLCFNYDTIFIGQPPPVISPFSDTSYCENDSLLLDPGGNFQHIWWSDSLNAFSRWVSQPDTFYLKVEDFDGCWSEIDTVQVLEDPMFSFTLGNDTTICYQETRILSPNGSFPNYLWNDNSTADKLIAYSIGTYWLQISKGACLVTDSIILTNCPPMIKLPNVFTPNQDGYNDYFTPIESQNLSEFTIKIYDRWGMKVYQSSDLDFAWDGKINNKLASEGVYFWIIDYEEYDGYKGTGTKYIQGTVTIIYSK